jgi:hypothetical protein
VIATPLVQHGITLPINDNSIHLIASHMSKCITYVVAHVTAVLLLSNGW